MTVYERIIIENKEMKGYDISDLDIEIYTKDRIRQEYANLYEKILTKRRKNEEIT